MKFVWCHVKNIVVDSFLSSASDVQGEWSHSVFLTTVVSCDCCILILTVRQRPCWYISWPQREQWGLKHTIHSWPIFIALLAFSRSAWTKALHVCNLYLVPFSCFFRVDQRSLFCRHYSFFWTLPWNPPPPSPPQKKNRKQKSDGALQRGSCTEFMFSDLHNMYFSFFCVSLCHIGLPLFLYLHEELSLTEDDRLQNPVFLEWPPSPIHSHHPCGLDLQC